MGFALVGWILLRMGNSLLQYARPFVTLSIDEAVSIQTLMWLVIYELYHWGHGFKFQSQDI